MLTVLVGFLSLICHAQQSPYDKFGKVTVEALRKKLYSIDSSANAVVLSDIGAVVIEGNSKGWFSSITTRHKVVHILNKSGYGFADVEIDLYTNGENEERLEDVKAVTYNLEGGNVVESKLEKSNIFTEKNDKNHITKKFTMPNVKEGSIIEFQYKVSSDFISNIDAWRFQGSAPRLWSEFRFTVPQFFSYAFVSHGYLKAITEKKDQVNRFAVRTSSGAGPSNDVNFSAGVTEYRWVMKDVPELKPENFTSTLENHVAKIEFQLVSQSEPLPPRTFRNTWTNLSKELLESEHFGANISGSNYWLDDEMKIILGGANNDLEKAQRIFNYIRDGYTCTSYVRYTTDQSLKAVFKARKGSVSELNLLLVAMLRHAGLQADPIILSQTNRGHVVEEYPMLSRFNYLIAMVKIQDQVIYLDASHERLGFGRLLPSCYNGHARVINEEATPLYLYADSLKEKNVTALFLTNDPKGFMSGNLKKNPGYYESFRTRGRVKEKGKDVFMKELGKEYGSDIKITSIRIDSLTNYDEPIAIEYRLEYTPEKESILYFNPLFGEGYKKNPFKSEERRYPVEMPYAIDETYVLTMDIPEGYVVDELPKQMVAKYDEEGKSFFEYRIQQSDNIISLRSRIKLDRAFYEPEEYFGLREFFNLVVKKHNEQIVFKKK